MDIKSQHLMAFVRKDTLVEMYEYGTGRLLDTGTLVELLSKSLDSRNRENDLNTQAEELFIEMTRGSILPEDFVGDDKPIIMAIAIIPRDGMILREVYAELSEQGYYPAGFSQAMCFFHCLTESERELLGKIYHFGTLFPDRKSGTTIAVTRGNRLDGFVPYPYGTFKTDTQVVVIKEEKVIKKR